MSGMMQPVLAADVGGTNLRLAVVMPDGNIAAEQRRSIHLAEQHHASPAEAEAFTVKALAALMQEMLGKHPVAAVGVGFPGFFRGDSGVLASSPNLPGLVELPLAERLAAALGIPVAVQNDALCAAIGEHRFGAAKGQANLLHITLGTGVGGGLIINNTPWTGDGGMAMEFGHITIDHSDKALPCGCGNRGCVETLASATAVKNVFEQLSGQPMEAEQIHQLALQGDTNARQALNQAGQALGIAIAEASKLLDVHLITISGGLTGAWSLMHPAIVQAMEPNLIPPLRGKIKIFHSLLGDNAGLLGAAAIVPRS